MYVCMKCVYILKGGIFVKVSDLYIAYPMDDPWAPIRPLISAFPQDFMTEREQPAWDAVPDREEL